MTLNTAVIGVFGFIEAKYPGQVSLTLLLGGLAGLLMSYYWYRIIESYKGLNTGKFKVIHLIEKKLPLSLYDTEWDAVGRGENKSLYRPFTHIEIKIPILFMVIYITLLGISFPWGIVWSLIK